MLKKILKVVMMLMVLISIFIIATISISADEIETSEHIKETIPIVIIVPGEKENVIIIPGTKPTSIIADTTCCDETIPIVTVPVLETDNTSELIISDEPYVGKDSVDGFVIGYIGDNDKNDKVNIRDATNIQKHMAKIITLSESANILSDADWNGTVNIKDATAIQKFVANIDVNSKIMYLYYETGSHIHNYHEVTVEPKCTVSGYTLYSCVCGDEYRENETNALGHSYLSKVIEPTCVKGGYTQYICTKCNNSYKDKYVDTVSHNYSSVVTSATCVDDGYITYTCDDCGDSYIGNVVSATGVHSYNNNGICINCGYKKPTLPSGDVAFDNLASWIKKNGVLSDDRKSYIVVTDVDTGNYYDIYNVTGLFYTPSDEEISILFSDTYNDYGGLVNIYRNSTNAEYIATLSDNYLVSGSFKKTEIKNNTKYLDYDLTNMDVVSSTKIKEFAASQVTLVLTVYKYYEVFLDIPVSLYDLGFINFN